MTKEQESKYEDAEILRDIIMSLRGRKFKLDCGHHTTVGHCLGNNITIINGSKPKLICSQCGY
jgi:hypothetical protein